MPMTAFDTDFAANAMPDLLDEFGEAVIYRPKQGRSRTITAIVTRERADNISPMTNVVGPLMTIKVMNDEDNEDYGGINADKWTKGDVVRFARDEGGGDEDHTIIDLIEQTGARCVFELR